MKVFLERNVAQDLVEDVKCNQCGEQVRKDRFGYIDDHLSVCKTWGYGPPADGETHSFDLCFGCYSELMESFAIPPRILAGFHELDRAQ